MPTLAEATQPIESRGLAPIAQPALPSILPGGQQYPANPNPLLRCPLPPVSVTPDSLRQFYQGGLIPQARIMTPPVISQSPTGGSVTNISNVSVVKTVSTAAAAPSKVGTVQNTSATTTALGNLQQYLGVLTTSSAFVPLIISVSSAARVELYATSASQLSDLLRPASVSPGAGTAQGILLDVTVDSSPFSWIVTPALPSANGNNPRQALAYITVTNLSAAVLTITATLQYLVLEP